MEEGGPVYLEAGGVGDALEAVLVLVVHLQHLSQPVKSDRSMPTLRESLIILCRCLTHPESVGGVGAEGQCGIDPRIRLVGGGGHRGMGRHQQREAEVVRQHLTAVVRLDKGRT